MDNLCNESCSASWPAILHCKNLLLDITCKLFCVLPNLFIPAMLMGTIEFYQFIPFLVVSTLPGGYKVTTKQNLLTSFCPILFVRPG